ncbi:cycloheximide resistance protein [Mariannaea sp. PMI_226]|nr:cycloheximide resistance protein [Mariannaea sp. PMI_226]
MPALLRDAPAGGFLRRIFTVDSLRYQDELPGFQLPSLNSSSQENTTGGSLSDHADEKAETTPAPPAPDSHIVDWYQPDDPDNPQNWSTAKKSFVMFEICLLTFAIYSGSAIITPAQTTIMELFGVSAQLASMTLSLYVLGYGFGPLLFSPLSEVPRLGRNLPYMTSFALYILITIATARVSNFPGLVVLRFLQGFLGGPVLATGAASASDILGFHKIPYGLTFWCCAAWAAPALGPLLSGYAVTEGTWRWTMYELLIMDVFVFLLLLFCLPETNADTILLHRAQRIRIRTGSANYQSQSEVKQGSVHLLKVMGQHLTTPFRITVQDPSIAFINVYTALLYAIYYSYFESFPIVYIGIYGFSIGLMGVAFLSIIVACFIGAIAYVALVWYIYEPYTIANGIGSQEYRLLPGVYASFICPVGVFLFGWTAKEEIHWIVPTIGVVLYSASLFILANVIFIYLPTSYPKHSASLFAANSFLRSVLACGAVHFSQPLFKNLGVGAGCSVLGGLTALGIFGVFGLWYFGARMRTKSKFTMF